MQREFLERKNCFLKNFGTLIEKDFLRKSFFLEKRNFFLIFGHWMTIFHFSVEKVQGVSKAHSTGLEDQFGRRKFGRKMEFSMLFWIFSKKFYSFDRRFLAGLSQLFFACREEQFEDFLYEKFFFLSFLDNEWKLLALCSKTVRHDQKISAVWPKFFGTQVKTAFYVSI